MNTKTIAMVGIMLLLGSCARTTTAPPNPFESQTLSWAACDPTLVDEILQEGVPGRPGIGPRIQCADVKVPLDWNNPERGEATIALLRVQAADTQNRKGSIFLNPGGPGGDGLVFGALYGWLWSNGDPTTKVGAALKQLSDQYDLIGFSPRGVGQSSRLTCGSNEQFSPVQHPNDRSQANIDAMLRNARLMAQACLKNPITRYINTDATARDLNLARHLLGDAKLNYIGYSYGSWLGGWFAKLFPDKTGRFMLNANMNFNGPMQRTWEDQPMAFERTFRDVALAYAARNDALFGLGKTKEEIYALYNSFPPDLKQTLLFYPNGIFQDLYSASSIPNIAAKLIAARGFHAVLQANPNVRSTEELAQALTTYPYTPNKGLNDSARNEALTMIGTYLALALDLPSPVELPASVAVLHAVRFNDDQWTKEPRYWVEKGNQQARDFPFIGGDITQTPGMYWPAPMVTKPAVPSNMPPLLLVQNEYDAPTALENALEVWKTTPNSRMILVDNEASHGTFPYGTECVDLAVAQYFLSGTLPASRFNVCDAKPLPGETEVFPIGQPGASYAGMGAATLAPQGQNVIVNAFGNTPQVEEVLNDIKDIIARNALKALPLR